MNTMRYEGSPTKKFHEETESEVDDFYETDTDEYLRGIKRGTVSETSSSADSEDLFNFE